MSASCVVNNYIQRNGFVMVSNLLISHQEELNISNRELTFLIKVMKHKENYKLHDEVLDPTVSTRTLQRCRKALKDKGLITYKVWRYTDELGHLHTEGITYDLSPLEEKLQQISDALAKEKEIEIEKEAENYLLEFGEESPMADYLTDWEEHYGTKYKLSTAEKIWYNNLSAEEQEYVGRIFEFCEEKRLFKEIVPRLALFIKNKCRFDQLKSWNEETPEEIIYFGNERLTSREYNRRLDLEIKKNREKMKEEAKKTGCEGFLEEIKRRNEELSSSKKEEKEEMTEEEKKEFEEWMDSIFREG